MNPPLPRLTDLTGLGGIALGLAARAVMGLRLVVPRLSRPRRAIALAAVAGLLLVPIGSLSAVEYVRGLTGDLSVTTLLLLWAAVLGPTPDRSCGRRNPWFVIQLGLAAAAAALYPMALGVGPFDPYRLGYGSPGLLGALGVCALAAWWARLPAIAFGVAAAVLAWALRGYESSNLWDYLIDPFAAVYAVVALLVRSLGWAWRAGQRHSSGGTAPGLGGVPDAISSSCTKRY
jgi:hypothetical protein